MAGNLFKGKAFVAGLVIAALGGGLSAWLTNLKLADMLAPEGVVELPDYVPPPDAPLVDADALGTAGSGLLAMSGEASSGLVPKGGAKVPFESYRFPILNRTIFDSATVGKLTAKPPVADVDVGEGAEGTEDTTQESSLAPLCFYVTHTMVVSPMRYSWAYLAKDERGGDETLYSVGDEVFEDEGSSLLSVGLRDVTIRRRDGVDTTYTIGEPCPEGATAPAQAAVVEAAPKAKTAESSELGSGIEKLGDNKFVIARDEIDKAMNNLEKLAKDARVVPHYQNGSVVGFKVFRIKANSVYSKLGLKNGDIIERVNGEAINGPERALALYQTLRNEKNFELDLQRRNQPLTLSYEVR